MQFSLGQKAGNHSPREFSTHPRLSFPPVFEIPGESKLLFSGGGRWTVTCSPPGVQRWNLQLRVEFRSLFSPPSPAPRRSESAPEGSSSSKLPTEPGSDRRRGVQGAQNRGYNSGIFPVLTLMASADFSSLLPRAKETDALSQRGRTERGLLP